MNKKEETFPFHVKDWLSDFKVRAMTPAQRGHYIELLAHMWAEGGKLVYNKAMFIGLLGISVEDLSVILTCFYEEGGFLYQKRLREEWERLDNLTRTRRKAANKRWSKNSNNRENRVQRLERVTGEFKASLNAYAKLNPKKYTHELYREFMEYWGIPENTKNPTKLVYEKEKSWNLPNRLATWMKNIKKHQPKETPTKGTFTIPQ